MISTKEIEKINREVSEMINKEVESKIRKFLEAANGTDWTNKFEEALKVNILLKEENYALKKLLSEIMEHYQTEPHDHAWAVWVTRKIQEFVLL